MTFGIMNNKAIFNSSATVNDGDDDGNDDDPGDDDNDDNIPQVPPTQAILQNLLSSISQWPRPQA